MRSSIRAHPRSRGENDLFLVSKDDTPGSSPLTRGKRTKNPGGEVLSGLIPAHAGKTASCEAWCCRWGAHPRSRGENLGYDVADWMMEGSSPLTRGKREFKRDETVLVGLIPAHAGKTRVT